jgi:DNA-directed RNA polymerase III subunit RPC3
MSLIHGIAPTSIPNIILQIPEDANLADGLAYSSKKVPISTCVKDYSGMLSGADNPSSEGRSASFISYSTSKVQVEFEIIARRLRRNIVETIAREKHGPEGARIVRLLLTTGKLDEKQVDSYLSDCD